MVGVIKGEGVCGYCKIWNRGEVRGVGNRPFGTEKR